jgi:hypothetical protein
MKPIPWVLGEGGADTYCRIGPFSINIRDSRTLPKECRHGRPFHCWAMLLLPDAKRRWGGKIPMEEPHLIHRGGFGTPHDWSTCYWYYESRKSAIDGMTRRFQAILQPWIP